MPDPAAVNSLFARIARRYDVANRLLSGGIDVWWRKRLVGAVKATTPHAVLDLATGSGDVAFALGRSLSEDTEILGMDFCQPMLDEAELKKKEMGGFRNIAFRQGDGMALPIEDDTFDAVTISFGLRNMADRIQSLREMSRVLRPGGRVFVLEFSQPQPWFRPIYFFYLRHILPWLAGKITGDRAAYEYLNATIEQFPGRAALAAELEKAGFTDIQARGMTFGIVALHVGKKG
ncbi:bifunctional demethylmenaquinone methyltransferase/2-methoxy-6-polyprenyl-1,4-benzoquinol methylase UbiE [Opitutaceae bacterium EW11]|nr:bifunctional demethylmenaquinone methyltransferase/2-methoxy-6-polyprenyl-1,4-benzoquinol methylase UbiE [Opitutaceae bacterium EW11]